MGPYRIEHKTAHPRRRFGLGAIALVLFIGLIFARSIAAYIIDYQWWKEIGQVSTWFGLLTYGLLPVVAATLLAFVVLWISHARAMHFAGTSLREHRGYAKLATLGALVLAYFIAAATVDGWTVVRYAGGHGLSGAAGAWHDPVFGQSLAFYLFDLPFYSVLRTYLLGLTIVCILVYWLSARAWQFAPGSTSCARCARWIPPCSGWRAAWSRVSCAALRWRFFWRWPCGFSWPL